MQLDASRFFSDRVVFDPALADKLQVTSTFWDWCMRIISWIWSPASYSDENRRTIACFKNYLVDALGPERLQRICTRYSLDFNKLENEGNPLLSRDVAKIVVGAKSVSVEDINEHILKRQAAGDPLFAGKNSFLDLDSRTLAEVQHTLSKPFGDHWQVEGIVGKISGRPTEWLSRVYFDPFLADRERLQLVEDHPTDKFESFIHNMVARVIKREMNVGTLIPAPNHPDGRKQFYYVSARVVSGKGMVSYLFHPATNDTNLEPIRLFRGTSARNSELDALSTVITDLEKDLGRTAHESGLIYDETIRQKLVEPKIEGGHSMGATVAQYRVANLDHIKEAFLFCGPGLPEKEVEKFNQKNRPVHLVIRHVKDDWHSVGDAHLGYKAPPNVHVDFLRYHGPKKNDGQNPHVTIWSKEPYLYGVEGGLTPEARDEELYHKDRFTERARSFLGPIVAYFLHLIRTLVRTFMDTRTHLEKGLKIGTMQQGRWRVEHFQPV